MLMGHLRRVSWQSRHLVVRDQICRCYWHFWVQVEIELRDSWMVMDGWLVGTCQISKVR